jgi:localization factor PodJL
MVCGGGELGSQAAAAAFEPIPLVAEANEILLPDAGWGDDSSSLEVNSGSDVSDNDLVALVQKLLAEQGFDPGPADGLLGRQTIEAITEFQEGVGLPATGQIDTGLVAALQERST